MPTAEFSWRNGVRTPNRATVIALAFTSAGISVVPAFWILPVVAFLLIALAPHLPTLREAASPRFMARMAVLVCVAVFPRGSLSLAFAQDLRPLSLTIAIWGLATVVVVTRQAVRGERLSPSSWWLMMAWMIGSTILAIVANPEPWIDVWHLHQDAGSALAQGVSPYHGRALPNPMPWFPEDSVFEGYTYPPVTLYSYALSAALVGESRWIAVLAGAGLVYLVRRLSTSHITDLVSVMLLMSPGWALMAQLAWTEPLSVLVLAAALAAGASALRASFLGLLVASKQYLLLWALPISLSWFRRNTRGLLMTAFTAAALYGVGGLYGWDGYFEWAFLFHTNQPQAELGASVPGLAWMLYQVELVVPIWLRGVAAAAVAVATATRYPRTEGSMVLSATLMLGTFFLLGTQSFPNYWYFILGGLTLSILRLNAEKFDETGTGRSTKRATDTAAV